jgi:RNA polymerase primary sigma factor
VATKRRFAKPPKSIQVSLQNIFDEVLQELKEKEQQVISLSFGLGNGVAYTDKEIARILGTTKERVRQIKAKALRRLKNHERIAGLK